MPEINRNSEAEENDSESESDDIKEFEIESEAEEDVLGADVYLEVVPSLGGKEGG